MLFFSRIKSVDPSQAKKMIDAGVPTVPGTQTGIESLKQAKEIVQKIGLLVLIKASRGGVGKGMRAVHKELSLKFPISAPKNEPKSALGVDLSFFET